MKPPTLGFPKPNPELVPTRKNVTVALAIKAIDGTVVATDRQQTEGELKVNWGKMAAQWSRGRGSFVTSGAGNGPYLDAIGAQLREWFNGSQPDGLNYADVLEPQLQEKHEEFYRRYVLPFENYQWNERPDYALLLVVSPLDAPDCIWTTHKLVLNREDEFAAVGSGGTVARALLDKFHIPGVSIDVAINLAAYVLWEVKQTVDGVGFETDIFDVRRYRAPVIIHRDEIARMEAQFKSYQKLETANLYHCLGGNITDAQRLNWGIDDDVDTRKKAIRDFFEKLNKERSARQFPLTR